MAPSRKLLWSSILLATTSVPASARDWLVHDQKEYLAAAAAAKAGDVIRLADGEWKDFPVLLQGEGTAKAPITLTAQTKGKAILTGASSLRMAGNYLVVSGLVFRDGAAPGAEVISFRRDARTYASHSRLTEVVVDHYNKADRRAEDRWVSLYGTDNRVDHSWFAGKGNLGVTLAVIRPKGQPQANRHRIDHNYFGPRPPLGSNGGETIRLGTSDESLSDGANLVEDNVFDRCDGEVEIVSIKSGANVVRGNLILQSQGSIVLRHGNGNVVERNVFLGKGKPHTGGVRVINERQVVRGNYMEGLAGISFTSALAVMNGVPGSSLARYHQVSGAVVAGNSMFDVARVTLGAGADAERTAPPVDSTIRDNLFTASADAKGGGVLRLDGDVGGITFTGNVSQGEVPGALASGVRKATIATKRAANGLLYPTDPALAKLGAPPDLKPVTLGEVGPSWYAKADGVVAFGSGRSVPVQAGALDAAVAAAKPGDVLRLAAGRYTAAAPLRVSVPLTLAGPASAEIAFSAPSLFVLEEGGRLRLEGLTVTGASAPRQSGNAVIRTAAKSTIANYALEIVGTAFNGLDGAPDFDLIATTPGTFADDITIDKVAVAGLSGTVLDAAAETGTKGYYAAEHIAITGSRFAQIGALASVLRGGTDESTFGPEVIVRGNAVAQSGPALLTLSGVQSALIDGNMFARAGLIAVANSVGAPETRITGNRFAQTSEPQVTQLYPQGAPRVQVSGNIMSGDAS
ncbi:polysaccharide lyase 6 family protein [Novosphingobium resinovorum]|uniref:polysaccharide lyase 6 family protein n=1 Tax=Novosphingobium resinovorum TaxID=158500 RepID=UPI002ED09722|nr:polysaccharide lyase 6 family protein [Novosphingobium resinovorum]